TAGSSRRTAMADGRCRTPMPLVRVLCTGPRVRPSTLLAATSKTMVAASWSFRAEAVRSERRTRSGRRTIHFRREASRQDQAEGGGAGMGRLLRAAPGPNLGWRSGRLWLIAARSRRRDGSWRYGLSGNGRALKRAIGAIIADGGRIQGTGVLDRGDPGGCLG